MEEYNFNEVAKSESVFFFKNCNKVFADAL